MDKRILKEGDPIEIEFEKGTFDWGTFLSYSFDEEDEGSGGFLMYERPPVVIGDKVREEIRFVPIDWIKEMALLNSNVDICETLI
jgi:hypothetical protein